ncbi:MAG: hypothetical protein ACRDU5_20515 [Mycobacterium sp.]
MRDGCAGDHDFVAVAGQTRPAATTLRLSALMMIWVLMLRR